MTFTKFTYVIETPPNKLETQHGGHGMWEKKNGFVVNFVKLEIQHDIR